MSSEQLAANSDIKITSSDINGSSPLNGSTEPYGQMSTSQADSQGTDFKNKDIVNGEEPEHLPDPVPGTASSKVRFSYYEEAGQSVISFFAKDSDESNIKVSLHSGGNYLRVVIPMSDASVYYKYIHLFGPAAPGSFSTSDAPLEEALAGGLRVIPRRTAYKVEVPLKKLPIEGIIPKWTGAEYIPGVRLVQGSEVVTQTPVQVVGSGQPHDLKPKVVKSPSDWDSLESTIAKEEEEGKQDIGEFFKKIFKNADEKTRLAMMKSFQTSNGTVLSTNWDEVSKTDYSKDIQPPKGQEFRKWNEIRDGKK